VGIDELRGAHAVGAEEGGGAGEGFGEAVGIAEAGVEESLLAVEGTGGEEFKTDSDDSGIGLHGFEVGLERVKQDVGGGGGLR